MSKVVALLPARWGSTRFPGKPLHLIAGKPLLQHVWERCSKARCVDEVVVATDDMRIAEAAFEFGAEVALTSKKHPSGTDRIAEVVSKMRGATHILNVQGDEPLVDPTLIDRLAICLIEEKVPMVTAANPFGPKDDPANPNVVKVVTDLRGDALYFSRSVIPFIRDAGGKAAYFRHHGIYGYSRRCLLQLVKWPQSSLEKAEQLEQLRALENGVRIRVLKTKHASVGVDTPEDVARVEKLLKR